MNRKEETDIKKELREIKDLLRLLIDELTEEYYPEDEMELDKLIQDRKDHLRFLV